jgi:hypothetical protein
MSQSNLFWDQEPMMALDPDAARVLEMAVVRAATL